MNTFHGDFKWVHKWEGHLGKPYWPKGQSGVTLDPGVDLGYAEWDLVERAYGPLITAEQLESLKSVQGKRGDAAEQALQEARANGEPFTSIRISRDQGDGLFGIVAEPYWNRIARRFPALNNSDTPGSVQTALLSLAYNRGPGNRDLNQLNDPLQSGDWRTVGERISGMQQDHKLEGIRRRRREEGQLILDSV